MIKTLVLFCSMLLASVNVNALMSADKAHEMSVNHIKDNIEEAITYDVEMGNFATIVYIHGLTFSDPAVLHIITWLDDLGYKWTYTEDRTGRTSLIYLLIKWG